MTALFGRGRERRWLFGDSRGRSERWHPEEHGVEVELGRCVVQLSPLAGESAALGVAARRWLGVA
eukprot:7937320-Lingulodinium_polyedra.AAC.1